MRLLLWLILLPQLASSPARETFVTRSEAAAVFAKAEMAIRRVLGAKRTAPPFARGKEVAGRDTLVKQFGALFDEASPKFKFLLPRRPYDPKVVTLKTPLGRAMAARLCSYGFVDKFGPLVASPHDGMTLEEFGDTLGYFLARLAELTHTSSQKFSPALMPP